MSVSPWATNVEPANSTLASASSSGSASNSSMVSVTSSLIRNTTISWISAPLFVTSNVVRPAGIELGSPPNEYSTADTVTWRIRTNRR